MAKIVVIQGPNLNMLGFGSNIQKYGPMKLEDIHKQIKMVSEDNKIDIEFFQSNLEGEIIDKIQECMGNTNGLIINPNAFRNSEAIKEVIEMVEIPTAYIELSKETGIVKEAQNIIGVISGFGGFGYHLATISLIQILFDLKEQEKQHQTPQQTQPSDKIIEADVE